MEEEEREKGMGLLTRLGSSLLWNNIRRPRANRYVLRQGVTQIIDIIKANKNRRNDPFLWGEEIEYLLIHQGSAKQKQVQLSLSADQLLQRIQPLEEIDRVGRWLPEYASFMLESTPMKPYCSALRSLSAVQDNMQKRYDYLFEKLSGEKIKPILLSAFPLLGVGQFTSPKISTRTLRRENTISSSLFVPDHCIHSHPRFSTLTRNIQMRRKRKICAQVPLFIDSRTRFDPVLHIDRSDMNRYLPTKKRGRGNPFPLARPEDSISESDTERQHARTRFFYPQYYAHHHSIRRLYDSDPNQPKKSPNPYPRLYMDCMAFGMGCCCLQVTMQLENMDEARYVYDQLTVLSPIMLALTASTAVQKGHLTECDVRWSTLCASVDDRTNKEILRIPKSRSDSVSLFLSPSATYPEAYNDLKVPVNIRAFRALHDEGFDPLLTRHIAHLFLRDPLVVFDSIFEEEKTQRRSEHFENIQSTNWQSVRFKPPPAATTDVGWRVEFRIMEISMSAFENAAFSLFTILLVRAILAYRLVCYLPLSAVELNLAQAHQRNAAHTGRFLWRLNLEEGGVARIRSISIHEIINGTAQGDFEGLAHYVDRLIEDMRTPSGSKPDTLRRAKLHKYVEFVRRKASGKIPTTAMFVRNFVLHHPTYRLDSCVTQEIASDWIDVALRCARGENVPPDLISPDLLQ